MSMTTAQNTPLTQQSPAEIDGQLFPVWEKLGQRESSIAGERKALDQYAELPYLREERQERIAKHQQAIIDLEQQAAPFEEEYDRRGGWSRYIVVPGGHLHKRHCHTLTPGRTMVGQVAESSGLSDDEVVAKYDEAACTHCFPDAPVARPLTPTEALAKDGTCPRSGEYVSEEILNRLDQQIPNWRQRYSIRIKCPDCGESVSLTKSLKYRKHKAAGK